MPPEPNLTTTVENLDEETAQTPEELLEALTDDPDDPGPIEQEENAEEESKQDAKNQEDEPVYSEDDFRLAAQFGLSREDVTAFPEPQRLWSFLQRQALRALADADRSSPPPTAAAAKEADDDLRIPIDAEKIGLEPEQVEHMQAAFVAARKADRAAFRKEVDELKGLVRGMANQQAATFQADRVRAFDAAVASLPEELLSDDLLGKGDQRAIQGNKKAYDNRVKLARQTRILEEGYRAVGQDVPSFDVLVQQAAAIVFAGRAESVARKKVQMAVAKRNGTLLHPPAASLQRSTEAKEDPTKASVRYAFERLRNAGINPRDGFSLGG